MEEISSVPFPHSDATEWIGGSSHDGMFEEIGEVIEIGSAFLEHSLPESSRPSHDAFESLDGVFEQVQIDGVDMKKDILKQLRYCEDLWCSRWYAWPGGLCTSESVYQSVAYHFSTRLFTGTMFAEMVPVMLRRCEILCVRLMFMQRC